ncbi:flagellar biosynthesis protein FlhB [Ferroacidibacillus organovorans]|uniref:Flagellar biosynthetic protein FlhB n=1 Tax=Ferroacidibacillus organovorans TaxID=1765683 RepID=A0A162UXI1_9BACL|nr:flagellar biosynthesis protein FlhB [Ferroacidibacillus organovorans]KYP82118.1 hypothetical protein AYJ22_00205 [Ferroacidibacillus organovorans]OAG94453.1 hypothetical protein AYW79_05405 [Ferroacidibacillus organovorans]OPG15663.1 flagellar biosynthesis protein FlhB [Ferroacidibacillus organovorans]
MIRLELQRFAEKTEQATPKRRQDARQKGRVAKSPDLTSSLSFLAAVVGMSVFGSNLLGAVMRLLQNCLSLFVVSASQKTPHIKQLILPGITQVGLALIPIVLTIMLIGMLAAFFQVGPMFTLSTIMPDFSKINPLEGIRRLFSLHAIVESIKSIVKLSLIGVALYAAVVHTQVQYAFLMESSTPVIIDSYLTNANTILLYSAVMFAAVSVADYFYQRYQFSQSLRMSRQDVRDEQRDQEGNPQMRRRIREQGRAIARRRMMQKVPNADVIITNPTHFAVALRYDAKTMQAPQVVAKGIDETAQRIREVARQHDVPIVENKPLARALYQTVELDEFVPGTLFQAVAEVLAYVYRLRGRALS